MHKHIKARFTSWKEIFWRKAVGIIAAAYFLLGLWDLFKSEFLPEEYQSWTVVKHTPHMSWRTWVIGILLILVVILLEGAHAAIQRRETKMSQLQTRIKLLRTKPLDWQQEWRDMESDFRNLINPAVFAECGRDRNGNEVWSINYDVEIKQIVDGMPNFDPYEYRVLCDLAGSRLLTSSPIIPLPADVASQQESWIRWLCFVRATGGFTSDKRYCYGAGKTYDGGSIENLAKRSADVCVKCRSTTYPMQLS